MWGFSSADWDLIVGRREGSVVTWLMETYDINLECDGDTKGGSKKDLHYRDG